MSETIDAKTTNTVSPDLTVVGMSIEKLYGDYCVHRFVVNRQYQRKLVWTVEEKRNLIDSIIRGYPIPIILLAEKRAEDGVGSYEIIDGMQRLNAIFSFIEDGYSLDAGNSVYFDQSTMAKSKNMMESGKISQKLGSSGGSYEDHDWVSFVGYQVPVSIYQTGSRGDVDEVFRRINSGGSKLSRQELRMAGATGHFSNLVRSLAADIRGDSTLGVSLTLNEMENISISNRSLQYGIPVEDVFWVKNRILTPDQVRTSLDEELLADIIAYCVLDPKPPSRSEVLDDYFKAAEDDDQNSRHLKIETAIQKRGDQLGQNIKRVFSLIRLVLDDQQCSLADLLFKKSRPNRAPRYFQVVFLALYKLAIEDDLEPRDVPTISRLMSGSGDSVKIETGGRWGASQRQSSVDSLYGVYRRGFKQRVNRDPATTEWVTQFENLLTQALTEQSDFDFKQGFLRLENERKFDEKSFGKMMKTLSAIANVGPGCRGYVVVGVVDARNTVSRIENLADQPPRRFGNFWISGVQEEIRQTRKTPDEFFQSIIAKVRDSLLSGPLREYVATHTRCMQYFDKTVFVFECESQKDPTSYGEKFYVRHGNAEHEILGSDYATLFDRFRQ